MADQIATHCKPKIDVGILYVGVLMLGVVNHLCVFLLCLNNTNFKMTDMGSPHPIHHIVRKQSPLFINLGELVLALNRSLLLAD